MKSLIVLFSIILSACSSSVSNQPQLLKATSVGYFGYYGSDFVEDKCFPFCGELLASKSNTVWIRGSSDSSRITESNRSLGLFTVVSVEAYLFNQDGTLRSDYKQSFCSFSASLNSKPASYYVYDEPYLVQGIDPLVMKDGLSKAIDIVHVCAPDVPTSIIFSGDEVLHAVGGFTQLVPNGLDWAGFDCYLVNTLCTDQVVQGLLILFDTFPSKQILIPDATLVDMSTEAAILSRMDIYKSYQSDNVIAVFPFIYQSFSFFIGAEDIPSFDTYYVNWFNLLK